MGASKEAGPTLETEIAAWLRAGGLVVAASERAARALAATFHRARRAEGLTAWPAPAILDWQTFLHTAWQDSSSSSDARLLLDPLQEQSIWANIAGSDQHMATLLEGPRNRMASLAMEAHKLLCSYAPQFLKKNSRAAWQQDAENFSAWLVAFDETCRAANLLSPARLPLELIPLLENPLSATAQRPPLLLAGFDRILPIQRRLFDAWGKWQETSASQPAREIHFYSAADAQSELTACALWCKRQLAADPQANLLVITQDLSERRGEIERAFLNFADQENSLPAKPRLFEFSLGIPLGQVTLARGAHLLLRWLSSPIHEHELDWLLSTGQTVADSQESAALQTHMRALRHRGMERTHWTLDAFLAQLPNSPLPPAWVNRMTQAQRDLADQTRLPKTPLDWAELVPHLLQTAGWPGARPLSSAEFQALRRWRQTVESCASLGFDGRRIRWTEFLSVLARALDETLFAPESRDAPIQIAGPAESAGLSADAIWFMGASENAWPSSGATHPLLPPEVQREAAMPHATSQLDWELSRAITLRLLRSAPSSLLQLCPPKRRRGDTLFAPHRATCRHAAARARGTVRARRTRTADGHLSRCEPNSLPSRQSRRRLQRSHPSVAMPVQSLRHGAPGGPKLASRPTPASLPRSAVNCSMLSFMPFGVVRRRAFVHTKQLQALKDRKAFVAATVHRVLQQEIRPRLRERMPRRYLELEEQRLIRLVTEWLDYEAARIEFEVTETEAERPVHLAGLTFDLRLDRIDRLNDNSLLVIDYKTGQVSPKSWELPRPDDVQLPLYAGFALNPEEELGGLVFAKVRSGKPGFSGHVGDARGTLVGGLSGTSALVKNKFSAEMLIDWRDCIEQLARDFLSGRAEVDPREYPKTCEHCGLESLCRIAENRALLDAEEDVDSDEEASDE